MFNLPPFFSSWFGQPWSLEVLPMFLVYLAQKSTGVWQMSIAVQLRVKYNPLFSKPFYCGVTDTQRGVHN